IARPVLGEVVPAGKSYRVAGAAWTGPGAEVRSVAVSTDGGKTWADAKLDSEQAAHCWRLWEYEWTPQQPGKAVLMARATDGRALFSAGVFPSGAFGSATSANRNGTSRRSSSLPPSSRVSRPAMRAFGRSWALNGGQSCTGG